MAPIIPRIGGKRRLVDLLLSRVPPHSCYVEVFAGGAAVFFARNPADVEVLNDVNGDLVNLYRVVTHHLEEFVRESELLPGPNRHVWSKDLPAYELPTGSERARVLARRHRDRPEWLLVAWAADGPARTVSVDVPELGSVSLRARPSGSVYLARGVGDAMRLVLVDRDGMLPTARMGGFSD